MRDSAFRDALCSVAAEGFFGSMEPISKLGEVAIGTIAPGFSWNGVAQELAARLPGMFYCGKNGVSWSCGRGGIKGRVVDTTHYLNLSPARDIVRKRLGPAIDPMITCNAGPLCKLLLTYALNPVTYHGTDEWVTEGKKGGYYQCKPGKYAHLDMYDASSYYFNLLSRLPSPKVNHLFRNGSIGYAKLSAVESETWRETLAWISDADVKPLRTAFCGVAMGSTVAKPAYCRAKDGKVKRVMIPGKFGPLRQTGLLVVRSGYEVCHAQSLQGGSLYSIIDCVTFGNGRRPDVWDSLAIPYRLRFKGKSHIVGRGVYRIGENRTQLYQLGYRAEEEEKPAESPGYSFAAHWLTGDKDVLNGLHNAFPGGGLSARRDGDRSSAGESGSRD